MKIKTLGKIASAMIISYALADASFDNFNNEVASQIKRKAQIANTYATVGNVAVAYLFNSAFDLEKKPRKINKESNEKIKQKITLKDYLKDEFTEFTEKRYRTLLNKSENKEILEQLTNKKIPILMFHKIGYQGDRYSVTPRDFEGMLKTMYEKDYFVLNFEDFIKNDLSKVPIDKKPYLITFDDAHNTQFKYLEGTNKIDSESAIGVMEKFFRETPNSGKGAVFYQSAFGVHDEFIYIFGNKENAKQKQDYLLENGYNIGSHTATHANLSKISFKKAREEILTIDGLLEMETTSDYLKEAKQKKLRTLARPYGAIEKNPEIKKFLRKKYDTILNATGGRTYLSKTKNFDPYSINRIEANLQTIKTVLKNENEQFVQTKETKEFFEKVYDFNPTISIDANEIEVKALASKF